MNFWISLSIYCNKLGYKGAVPDWETSFVKVSKVSVKAMLKKVSTYTNTKTSTQTKSHPQLSVSLYFQNTSTLGSIDLLSFYTVRKGRATVSMKVW